MRREPGEVVWMGDTRYVYPDDYYPTTKAICTCPHCQIIWPHREVEGRREVANATARYGGVVRCPECGGWSRLEVRRGWLGLGRTYRRIPCDPPEREVTADADVER